MEHSKSIYRADIDGMRALAVIAVLLYHVGVPGFAGGFVGVDVFFVISGYLICGMIHGQLGNGAFSLADFYKRRIMRIIPALAVMMLVTTVLAYLYFLPVELNEYAFSLISAALSVSNVYFSNTAGYFDSPALTKPLLHTWSLGVEEQFYFVIPLVMMCVARFSPKHMRAALAFAAGLSFILACIVAIYSPIKAFYLAPFRAWELLLGALLAVGALPVPAARPVRNAIGILGLVLILGIVVFASHNAPFIVVTGLSSLGAVLIIASTSGDDARSSVGRVLALRPVVFVGLISYSVYLWHWPIFVFLRTRATLPEWMPAGSFQAIVVILSLVAGYLSWRFIELPFRRSTPKARKRMVFGTFATATLVLGGLGTVLFKLEGVPSRFSPQVVNLGSYLAYDPTEPFRQGRCYLTARRQTFDDALCLQLAKDRPNYLLLGDSFAAHLWLGLSSAMPNVNLLQASVGQCRPVMVPSPFFDHDQCSKLRAKVFQHFLTGPKVDKVVLAAAWKDEDIAPLLNTVDALQARGLKVTVLGPLVEYQKPLPRLLADGLIRDDPSLVRRMRDPSIPGRDREMKALVTAKGADYVSLYALACPAGVCQEFAESGVPFQFDTGHLTAQGSIALGKRLVLDHALTN